MAGKIHHVAVNTANFDRTVQFFQEIFEMEISRTRGEAPNRQLWFQQGIQVCEVPEVSFAKGVYDHIGIAVDNQEEVLRMVPSLGCQIQPGKPHWFLTPDGIMIELK